MANLIQYSVQIIEKLGVIGEININYIESYYSILLQIISKFYPNKDAIEFICKIDDYICPMSIDKNRKYPLLTLLKKNNIDINNIKITIIFKSIDIDFLTLVKKIDDIKFPCDLYTHNYLEDQNYINYIKEKNNLVSSFITKRLNKYTHYEIMVLIAIDPKFLLLFPKSFTKNIILKLTKINPYVYIYLEISYKNDIDIINIAIGNSTIKHDLILKYFDKQIITDTIAKTAILNTVFNIVHIPKHLITKELVMLAINSKHFKYYIRMVNNVLYPQVNNYFDDFSTYIPSHIIDKEIILSLFDVNDKSIFNLIPHKLENDKEIILRCHYYYKENFLYTFI